jgi:hypothetical protein
MPAPSKPIKPQAAQETEPVPVGELTLPCGHKMILPDFWAWFDAEVPPRPRGGRLRTHRCACGWVGGTADWRRHTGCGQKRLLKPSEAPLRR